MLMNLMSCGIAVDQAAKPKGGAVQRQERGAGTLAGTAARCVPITVFGTRPPFAGAQQPATVGFVRTEHAGTVTVCWVV